MHMLYFPLCENIVRSCVSVEWLSVWVCWCFLLIIVICFPAHLALTYFSIGQVHYKCPLLLFIIVMWLLVVILFPFCPYTHSLTCWPFNKAAVSICWLQSCLVRSFVQLWIYDTFLHSDVHSGFFVVFTSQWLTSLKRDKEPDVDSFWKVVTLRTSQ